MADAGWYRDPTGQGEARYWDGARWTDSVSRGGYTVNAPISPAQATVPPAPGSEYVASAPAAPQASTPNITVSSGGGGGNGPVIAIVAGIAVVVAIIAIVVALSGNGGDDDSPTTTSPPATPEAPPGTDPPDPEAP